MRWEVESALFKSSRLGNIEIIASDDASNDCSVEITTRLMAEDDRIRLLRSDCHPGPATARDGALGLAKGEWIAIVDSDDFMHPTRLATEKLAKVFATAPGI